MDERSHQMCFCFLIGETNLSPSGDYFIKTRFGVGENAKGGVRQG